MFFGGDLSKLHSWSASKKTTITSRANWFRNHIDELHNVADIFSRIEIQCSDAIDLINRFSVESNSLIYADPPYPMHTRTAGTFQYKHETSDRLHVDIHEAASSSKSLIAISTSQNDLYDDLYKDWRKVSKKSKNSSSISNGKNKIAIECLFMNYDELGNKIA